MYNLNCTYVHIYVYLSEFIMYLCAYLFSVIPGELTQTKQTLYNQNVSINMHTQYI